MFFWEKAGAWVGFDNLSEDLASWNLLFVKQLKHLLINRTMNCCCQSLSPSSCENILLKNSRGKPDILQAVHGSFWLDKQTFKIDLKGNRAEPSISQQTELICAVAGYRVVVWRANTRYKSDLLTSFSCAPFFSPPGAQVSHSAAFSTAPGSPGHFPWPRTTASGIVSIPLLLLQRAGFELSWSILERGMLFIFVLCIFCLRLLIPWERLLPQ